MKLSCCGAEIEISDWNKKTKISAVIFGMTAIVTFILSYVCVIFIPGAFSISLGVFMLHIGIKMFNIYFKECKKVIYIILAVLLTISFGFSLKLGINQIVNYIN